MTNPFETPPTAGEPSKNKERLDLIAELQVQQLTLEKDQLEEAAQEKAYLEKRLSFLLAELRKANATITTQGIIAGELDSMDLTARVEGELSIEDEEIANRIKARMLKFARQRSKLANKQNTEAI